ncbi:MAG TPA: PadR family transcriptional regulator [Acidimicrobiales bacterium]
MRNPHSDQPDHPNRTRDQRFARPRRRPDFDNFDGFGAERGFGGRGPGGRGRGRARRGDVRAAVLALLAEKPMHGYEMIQVLAERTGGVWKPSPGSIYPSLQLLEDEGLVQVDESSGKRLFTLTDAGRTHLAEHPRERTPWEEATAGIDPADAHLRELVGQIMVATRQVGEAGTAEHKAKADALLTATRRSLYAILAEPE